MKKRIFITIFILGCLFFGTKDTKAAYYNFLLSEQAVIDFQSETCTDPEGNCPVKCYCRMKVPVNQLYEFNFFEEKNSVTVASIGEEGLTRYVIDVNLENPSGAICRSTVQSESTEPRLTNWNVEGVECILKTIPATRACCCKDLEAGTNTIKKSCIKITDIEFSPSVCQEELRETNPNDYLDYFSLPVPKDGSCETLENEEFNAIKPTENTYSFSPEELQAMARQKLNPMKFGSLNDLIARGIDFMLAPIGTIGLVLYLYAGVLWMTAAGNSENIAKAKKVIIWTSFGLFVMISSYLIVKWIFDLFNTL